MRPDGRRQDGLKMTPKSGLSEQKHFAAPVYGTGSQACQRIHIYIYTHCSLSRQTTATRIGVVRIASRIAAGTYSMQAKVYTMDSGHEGPGQHLFARDRAFYPSSSSEEPDVGTVG